MPSNKTTIETLITDVAQQLIAPFVDLVIEQRERFTDEDAERDDLISFVSRELQLSFEEKASSATRSNKTSGSVRSAVAGLTANKTAPKSKGGKKAPKEDQVWLSVDDYRRAIEENPDDDICGYSPPRGQHKEFICGSAATSINRGTGCKNPIDYRCKKCETKSGRGATLLSAGNGPVRASRKKEVAGVSKRSGSRPADKGKKSKKTEDEDEEDEDDEEDEAKVITIDSNKSLKPLLGPGFYLLKIEGHGTCLVHTVQDDITVYGKFKTAVNQQTTITEKMIRELVEIKPSAETIEKYGLIVSSPSELAFNNDGEDEDSEEEEEEKKITPAKNSASKASKKKAESKKQVEEEEDEEEEEQPKVSAAKASKKKASNKKPVDEEEEEEEEEPVKVHAKGKTSSERKAAPAKKQVEEEEEEEEDQEPVKPKSQRKSSDAASEKVEASEATEAVSDGALSE